MEMFVASRMRRRQRIFTFIFLASFFKAGYLPVLELGGTLELAALLVLVRQGGGKFSIDGKGTLQARKKFKSRAIKPLSRLKNF